MLFTFLKGVELELAVNGKGIEIFLADFKSISNLYFGSVSTSNFEYVDLRIKLAVFETADTIAPEKGKLY